VNTDNVRKFDRFPLGAVCSFRSIILADPVVVTVVGTWTFAKVLISERSTLRRGHVDKVYHLGRDPRTDFAAQGYVVLSSFDFKQIPVWFTDANSGLNGKGQKLAILE
jgi:hypothetical protein